ncbi:hypothetical protein [Haladaptatus sp. NG-SE-30]
MVPRTTRDLLEAVRPVVGVMAGWAAVVLVAEFGIKNVGYHEPLSLLWWLGTLTSVTATVVALAAVFLYVLSQAIALGTAESDGSRSSVSTSD